MIASTEKTICVQLIESEIPKKLKENLLQRLAQLDIDVMLLSSGAIAKPTGIRVKLSELFKEAAAETDTLIEAILQQIPFEFESLPLLVEGESKIIRLLTPKIVVEQFKPTVYSFTHNRYGIAEKTDELRIKFSAEVFRRMNFFARNTNKKIKNAFLASVSQSGRWFLMQEKMKTTNLEVRVKRYHIGSPVHRYLYTEKYPTQQKNKEPLQKWSRFNKPVVCFDWRHPLTDENGKRLADEPISDDYAAIWMKNIPSAKMLASEIFLWLETLFHNAGLVLIDICFFIDEAGTCVFGEISPDCFRVRESLASNAKSYDKDVWRKGGSPEEISERYESLYNLLFKTK